MEEKQIRNYKMDNIRFILIFLTVFGHLIELFSGKYRDAVYVVIYSFHMPCFLFITGYFAKNNPRKILRHLVLPYIVFQVFYLVFQYCVLNNRNGDFALQFTTPYWLLWYLLTVIFYNLLLPIIQTENKKWAAAVIAASILLSLLAGFDKTVGYYLSLSRTVVFFPFFVTGYYMSNLFTTAELKKHKTVLAAILISAAVLLGVCEYLIFLKKIPSAVLYGAGNYAATMGSAGMRFLIGVCAFSWIALFLLTVPDRSFPVLTSIGQNTLPVFLIHGFLQRLLLKFGVFHFSQLKNLLLASAMTCLILVVLGSRPVGKVFRKIF